MQADIDYNKVAKLLGLVRSRHVTRLWLADQIQAGFPLDALKRVETVLDPKGREVTQLFVAGSTLKRRRKSGTLNSAESQKLERAARVWTLAIDVYKDEGSARQFLRQPHPLLEGRRPLDVAVATDVGADTVEGILGRLKYGSAA